MTKENTKDSTKKRNNIIEKTRGKKRYLTKENTKDKTKRELYSS